MRTKNVDRQIVSFLRSAGHDVLWMVEHAPGTADLDVISLARSADRILLTFDRDFGELVFHASQKAHGIILFRLVPVPPDTMLDIFQKVWPQAEPRAQGHFIVATDKKIRIRPMPA